MESRCKPYTRTQQFQSEWRSIEALSCIFVIPNYMCGNILGGADTGIPLRPGHLDGITPSCGGVAAACAIQMYEGQADCIQDEGEAVELTFVIIVPSS